MRKWVGLIAAVAGVLLLVAVIYGMGRGVLAVLNGMGTGGEPDPMYDLFPEELSRVTRPPELVGEAPGDARTLDDPSSAWVYEEETPVDKTAGELALEDVNS